MNMWAICNKVHCIQRDGEGMLEYQVRRIEEQREAAEAEVATAQKACLSIIETRLRGKDINHYLVSLTREAIWRYFHDTQYSGAVAELHAVEFKGMVLLLPCKAGEQFSISIRNSAHTFVFTTKSLHQERLNAANHFRNW